MCRSRGWCCTDTTSKAGLGARHTMHMEAAARNVAPWLPNLLTALLVLLATPQQAFALPHVSECNFCSKCQSGASSGTPKKPQPGASPFSNIFPTAKEIEAKVALPNCTECVGCTTELQPLKAVVAFGQDFKVERGASPEWIFTTELPKDRGGGKGVLKVWCMPIDKVHGTFEWTCEKSDHAAKSNQFLVAQDKVVEECGLMDITIKVWVAPVNAVEPQTGVHIWWDGLWMERAPGISLNQLSYITRKQFVQDTIQTLMQKKLNRTRVVHAAMLDLLTSQCDRHGQNIFIDENGQLTLIDNLQAMQLGWQNCGADSVFLPGTQKNEIARFGGSLVFKNANAKMKRTVNPMVLLDYRCYVEGGRIGTNYPPDLKACLKKLSGMTPQGIMDEYGFPFVRNAEALHRRATDMLEKGFEETLQQGRPHNVPGKRYRWHEPCCKLEVGADGGSVQCAHAWDPKPELPFGDPVTGREWKRTFPDPGSFEGGTVYEEGLPPIDVAQSAMERGSLA